MLRVIHHLNKVFSSVSYILFDDVQRYCWIVDVGDWESISRLIVGYDLKGILLTHIHYDHIYGLNDLQSLYPQVPIYTNKFGLKSLKSPTDNLSAYHHDSFILKDESKVVVLQEGDIIELSQCQVMVMETPGHDYSCLSYLVDDICFTGDAYIPGYKVFSKLQNGDKEAARKSRERLKNLDGVMIFSGHLIR